MKNIIIDTDIGDDIDDALAIAYALNSKELNVVGITTTFRNTDLRTQLVLQQLKAFDRLDIPVATGVGSPLIAATDIGSIPTHWDPDAERVPNNCNIHAVDFIVETLRKYPDTIIAAIAPLTNIACAVRKAPDVMKSATIWSMCGMYSEPYPEWNIVCDPEAADIVFKGCENIVMVGLDVTLTCRMTARQVEQMADNADARSALLASWTRRWMNTSGHLPILHDPLVVAAIEHPELIELEPKKLRVECAGNYCRGVTLETTDPFWRRPVPSNMMVAVSVDSQRFERLFLSNVFQNISTNK